MKTFVTKLIILLGLFICIDQLCGIAFDKFYDQVKSGTIYKTNYALRESTEEIVIFGASEVSHSLISNQIRNRMGMTCYNMGLDGQSIYYQYAVLNELLRRYSPKIVIISTNILHENRTTNIASLFPYYYKYINIRNLIREVEPSERIKLLIKSYAYNSLIIKVIEGNIRVEPETNGYIPLFAEGNDMQLDTTPYRFNITDITLEYFLKFIEACKEANCKVFVIGTPKYFTNIDIDQHQMIKKLLDEQSIDFLDFTTDTTFTNHPELFKDKPHLNHNGAIIFTDMVIDEILQLIRARE